jgi:hypothetical protein
MRQFQPLWMLLSQLLAVACSSEMTQLQPAAAVVGSAQAVTRDSGVTLSVATRTWPGANRVDEMVTALQVRIENESAHAILIRHSDFSLVSSAGTRYLAIPPVRVDASSLRVDASYEFISPDFEYVEFRAAPYYASIFPGLPTYADFSADPSHYGYYDYWRRSGLPTPSMLARALPEGVLDEGGRLSGWLYFQKLTERDERVALRASFEAAVSGTRVASFEIPFTVKRTERHSAD